MQPVRVAIVGASSLRGRELKEAIEAGQLLTSDIRLLDEATAAGTLTVAAGEPVVIQPVTEESFERVRFAFFAGEASFAIAHWREAQRAGASVIDLTCGLAGLPEAFTWIPALDAVLPRSAARPNGAIFVSPFAPVILACAATAALEPFGIERLAMLILQPVSERGQAAVEELERQTVGLLSLKPIAQPVFDTQVAFNLVDHYGEGSRESFAQTRNSLAREIQLYLRGRGAVPAVQLIQAPVFHSTTFSMYAELKSRPEPDAFRRAAEAAGLHVASAGGPGPSNISVAGEAGAEISAIERDPNVQHGYWLWGAADNLRLAASNAVQIAEKLLAS